MRRLTLVVVAVATAISAAGNAAAQLSLTSRAATIRIGGRMSVQYANSSVESYNDQFFFRRARAEADITVNDLLDGALQADFGRFGAALKDAYVRLKFSPELQVTMGQFKRAFDLFELSSGVDLSLIERDAQIGGLNACAGVGGTCSYSRLTEKLGLADRDIGVRVAGAKKRVAYELSMTNGAGQNVADENDAKSFSGRVSVKITPELTVSGNLASHDYVDPAGKDARAAAWGVDAQYGSWRHGPLVQVSLVNGDNWKMSDAAGDPVPFLAFQAVASWYAPIEGKRFVGVEPLLRVSWADANRDAAGDGGMIITPGLMFYVSGPNKVGFNIDFWSPQAGKSEHSLKVQSFLYF